MVTGISLNKMKITNMCRQPVEQLEFVLEAD